MTRKPRVRLPPTPTIIIDHEVSTFRDEIALRAMTTLIGADQREFLAQIAVGHGAQSFENVALISYGLADAMLKERGK